VEYGENNLKGKAIPKDIFLKDITIVSCLPTYQPRLRERVVHKSGYGHALRALSYHGNNHELVTLFIQNSISRSGDMYTFAICCAPSIPHLGQETWESLVHPCPGDRGRPLRI
jgi:hypothetical protein